MSPILEGVSEFLNEKGFSNKVGYPTDPDSPERLWDAIIHFDWKAGVAWIGIGCSVPAGRIRCTHSSRRGHALFIDMNESDSLDQILTWLEAVPLPATLTAS